MFLAVADWTSPFGFPEFRIRNLFYSP
jgi:hypothetical protein